MAYIRPRQQKYSYTIDMGSSISDILSKRSFGEADELERIKKFVHSKFGEEPRVKIADSNIIITVSNAAIAGNLRYQLHTLQENLKTDKKLLIRIG